MDRFLPEGAGPALALNRNRNGPQLTEVLVIKEYFHHFMRKEWLSDVDGLYDGAVFQHENGQGCVCCYRVPCPVCYH